MIFTTYFICGLLYAFRGIKNLVDNKQQLSIILEKEYGENYNFNTILATLLFTSIICWPILMLQEINKKDVF